VEEDMKDNSPRGS